MLNYQTSTPTQFETQLADALMRSPSLSDEDTKLFLEAIVDSASNHGAFVASTLKLMDKFYNHPNSPYRSEARYILVLSRILESKSIAEEQKISPRIILEQLLKNSVGDRAANFGFESLDGEQSSLYDIDASYTILFFNDPDCQECANIKRYLVSDPQVLKHSEIKILAIYPDTDYELWRSGAHPRSGQWINAFDPKQEINNQQLYHITALPTLYLLDREKRVIMKDVDLSEILEHISKL